MRIALVLVIALAASIGCAKKAKPAAAPTATEVKEPPPPNGGPDAEQDKDQTKGDPCDGGETKAK